MKKFIPLFFLLLIIGLSSKSVFAQMITPQSEIDNAINGGAPEKSDNVTYTSNISVLVPTFENRIYNKGDSIKVTLPLKNNDNVDYPDIVIVGYLSVYSKDGQTKDYGYQNNLAQVFLSKQTTKNL